MGDLRYSTSDFKKGLKIECDGKPFTIVDFLHVKPGKGGAFVRTKLKNLLTGGVIDQTFRAGEQVVKPDLVEKEMQYLYKDKDLYNFMDNETFEQISLTGDQVGGSKNFLQENTVVKILFYKDSPIDVELPTFVEIKIAKTTPGIKGDTVSGTTKPATIETGATIQVPLFVNEGDTVKVDTRTGTYIERAK